MKYASRIRDIFFLFPGVFSSIFIFSFTLGAVIACSVYAGFWAVPDRLLGEVTLFTIFQALFSALISLLLGTLCAVIVYKYNFSRSKFFHFLLCIPIIFPILSLGMGLLTLWGRNGLANEILSPFGIEFDIYGVPGILMANIFLNLPFVIKVILSHLETTPSSYYKIADNLGFDYYARWIHVEYPIIASLLYRLFFLIFVFCISNFSIVYLLGSGPENSTIEVLVFSSLRMEFRPDYAVIAANIQILICIVSGLVVLSLSRERSKLPRVDKVEKGYYNLNLSAWKPLLIPACIFSFLVAFPVIAFLYKGTLAMFSHNSENLFGYATFIALLRSFEVATISAVINIVIVISMIVLVIACMNHNKLALKRLFELLVYIPLFVSPVIISSALLITIGPKIDLDRWGLVLVALVNAVFMIPIGFSILFADMYNLYKHWFKHVTILNLPFFPALKNIFFPLLKKPLGLVLGITFSFSMGDISSLIVFNSYEKPTLSMLSYRNFSAYHGGGEWAFGASLILVMVTSTIFFFLSKGSWKND